MDDLWNEITKRTNRHWITGCGTKGPNEIPNDAKAKGLVTGHAYSISGSIEFDIGPGVKARLLRVRNTWGNKEWNGPWSDSDQTNWTLSRRREVIKKFGTFQEKNDGIFFIPIEDFKNYYILVYFADIADDTYKHTTVVQSMWTTQNFRDRNLLYLFCGKPPHSLHMEPCISNDYKNSSGLSIGFRLENKGGVEVFRSRRTAARNVWGETSLSQNVSEIDIATKLFGNPTRNVRFSLVIRSSTPFRACVKAASGSVGQCLPSHMSDVVAPKLPPLALQSAQAQGNATWEWEQDGGSYIPYSKLLSDKIEQAFRAHSSSCQIEPVRGKIYVIDFRGMKQTSSRGFHRSIRRVSVAVVVVACLAYCCSVCHGIKVNAHLKAQNSTPNVTRRAGFRKIVSKIFLH